MSALKFEPLYDRIAVEPLPLEEKTAGGIIIPDSAKEKPMRGKVIAIGQGSRNDKGDVVPLRLKIGDVVVYGKWAGTEVKLDDREIIVMKESDVMGVLS